MNLTLNQTYPGKRAAIVCFTFFLLLGNLPVYGQKDLVEEIKALSTVPKGLQFDPADVPVNANPFLSLLPPGSKRDYQTWRNYYQRREQYERVSQSSAPGDYSASSQIQWTVIEEEETVPGQNDAQSQGQYIKNFGSGPDEENRVVIRGTSGRGDVDIKYKTAVGEEDDGSIPLANKVAIQKNYIGKKYSGKIGDGPVKGFSDFDFYQVKAKQGRSLYIEVNTPDPFLDLDPFLSVFDAYGELLDYNDDGSLDTYDSKLIFEIPYDGVFYVCVGGYGAFIPSDPFDSESGSISGDIGSEGKYKMRISFIETPDDTDYYVFKLRKGDVFAAGIRSEMNETFLTVNTPDSELAIGSIFNTSLYPMESPLNLEGNTTLYHIAQEDGNYAVSVSNNFRDYELELLVTRPKLEAEGGTQIIFLDFDGAEFDIFEFFDIPGSEVRRLSPFREFLSDWGIADDPFTIFRMTRRITQAVKENVKKDLSRAGINPNFDVVIIGNTGIFDDLTFSPYQVQSILDQQAGGLTQNTAFHGLDNNALALLGDFDIQSNFKSSAFPISRVIVGGTIEESGIETIGIAQSIDPGNFANKETALVLLDILSAPPIGTPESFSLNDIPLAPGVDIEDLVVTALGNIIAHEIGHYLGNWHTDGFDEVQTLMDEGPGGIFNLIGMNPDGVFGDRQTIDVDFTTDRYSTLEVFVGTEDTKNQTAWGLSSRPLQFSEHLIAQSNQETGARLSQPYPNPSAIDQVLSITFKIDEQGPVQLELYDFRGEKVAVLFNEVAEAEREYHLDFTPSAYHLKSGMYVYRMRTEKGTLSNKIYLTK